MTYILNIYEKNKYIYSNISYNGKLLFKIKKNSNSLHDKIQKTFKKHKFKIKKINAVCVNFGPSISYTRIRIILSSAKGLCLSLNIPLIMVNDFLILIKKKIKFIKKKKYDLIYFKIFSYNKKKIYIKIYDVKKKKFIKKISKNNKYIFKKIFFIKKKYKNFILNKNKNIYFYKINYNDIIKLSYELYKKKIFIKNINLCEPIYT